EHDGAVGGPHGFRPREVFKTRVIEWRDRDASGRPVGSGADPRRPVGGAKAEGENEKTEQDVKAGIFHGAKVLELHFGDPDRTSGAGLAVVVEHLPTLAAEIEQPGITEVG